LNDPYEGAVFDNDPMPEARKVQPAAAPAQPSTPAERAKQAIEQKAKRFVSALDHAESITVDGELLSIVYSDQNRTYKTNIESRENRRVIEEICREALGHNVTLSVSVGSQSGSDATAEKEENTRARQKAENDPGVRALKEKFRGELVEVINKPEV
jgi:hypothetical protein